MQTVTADSDGNEMVDADVVDEAIAFLRDSNPGKALNCLLNVRPTVPVMPKLRLVA